MLGLWSAADKQLLVIIVWQGKNTKQKPGGFSVRHKSEPLIYLTPENSINLKNLLKTLGVLRDKQR